jgi:hypothetical protein
MAVLLKLDANTAGMSRCIQIEQDIETRDEANDSQTVWVVVYFSENLSSVTSPCSISKTTVLLLSARINIISGSLRNHHLSTLGPDVSRQDILFVYYINRSWHKLLTWALAERQPSSSPFAGMAASIRQADSG